MIDTSSPTCCSDTKLAHTHAHITNKSKYKLFIKIRGDPDRRLVCGKILCLDFGGESRIQGVPRGSGPVSLHSVITRRRK